MRKWTYLVAALLMSGSATTFTSCIDTSEPAGIEDLRGAKAEFIRAKAQYELALVELQKVKVEREKIKLELDKIEQQMQQLAYELEQAENESEKQRITLAMELAQKEHEAAMINADAAIVAAQQMLLEATNSLELAQITDRDNKFQAEISRLRIAVSGAIQNLTSQQNLLSTYEFNKIQYISKYKYYLAGLELDKAALEKDLEILNTLLTNYTEMESADMEELNKQKANIESQIIALRKKEAQEWDKYQAMTQGEEFTAANKAVQDIIVKLEAESSFTLPMAKVDATIQEDLYTALNSMSAYQNQNLDKFFNENKDAMIADLLLDKDFLAAGELKYQDLADQIDRLAETVIGKGKNNYTSDYNILFFGSNLTSDDIFDEKNEILESISTKVEAEKNRLASDKDKYKADYDAALKAWVDTYIAFNAALKAYGGYETTKPMDDMRKTIADIYKLYNASLEPEATAITLAKAKEWRTTIEGLYQKRNAVDGALESEYETFYNTYVKDAAGTDLITDANLTSQLPAFLSQATSDFNNASNNLNLSASYNESYEGSSKFQKYVNAYVEFFGNNGYPISLDNITEPVLNADGTAPTNYEDAIPADKKEEYAEVGNSVYNLYWASVNFDLVYPGLANYANWKSTYDFIADAQAKEEAAIDQLVADKEAKIAEYNDLFTALWEVELKGFLINGTQNNTTHGTGWFSQSNPYAKFVNEGSIDDGTAIAYDNQTEYAKLDAQLKLIQSAIDNDILSYVKYENGEFTTTNGNEALEDIIEDIKKDINEVQQDIQDKEFLIAQFNESGFTDNSSYTLDTIEKDIEDQKLVVAEFQQILDMLTAQLQKVVDAYAGTAAGE